MPAFKGSELKKELIERDYSSAKDSIVRGEKIGVLLFACPARTEAKPHARPNEQIQVALKGKVRGRLAGEIYILEPGDIVLKPPNIEQSGQVLEDYTTLNCKDIVPGWSVYHARWEK